jgi:predicted ribosome quality control (RQC) complex YloA/Tae2 family protein
MADTVSAELVAERLAGLKELMEAHTVTTAQQLQQINRRLDQGAEDDRRRDEQMAQNKDAAIEARQRLEKKVDGIARTTSEHADWIKTVGQPLADAHAAAAAKRAARAERSKGAAWAVAKIGGGISLAISAVWGLFGEHALDAVKRFISGGH